MANIINAITTGGGGISTTADASGSIQFATNNGTTAMTIDTSQNVGIGTASPADSASFGKALDIAGSAGNGSAVYVRANASATNYLALGQDNSGNSYVINRANSPMLFYTNNTERMRIDSSGNVTVANGSITASTLDVGANRYIIATSGVFFNNSKGVTCVTTNVWYNIGFPEATTSGLFAFRDASRGGTAVFRADTSVGAVSISNGITGFEMQWAAGGTQQMQIRVTSGSNITIRIICLATNFG